MEELEFSRKSITSLEKSVVELQVSFNYGSSTQFCILIYQHQLNSTLEQDEVELKLKQPTTQ